MDQQIIRNLFSHSRLLDSTAKPKQFLDMACRVVGPPFSHSSRHASVKRLGADLHAAATFVQVGARADDISMPLLGCPIVQIRPPANALGLQVAHFTGHPICPPARSSSTSRLPSSSGCTSTGRPQAGSRRCRTGDRRLVRLPLATRQARRNHSVAGILRTVPRITALLAAEKGALLKTPAGKRCARRISAPPGSP